MNRRQFLKHGGAIAGAFGRYEAPIDYRLEIAPAVIEFSSKRSLKTVAYNGIAPGPLVRLTEGRRARILVTNRTNSAEIVHWHGLLLPSQTDGAMEEGSPMIAPGDALLYEFTPRPA